MDTRHVEVVMPVGAISFPKSTADVVDTDWTLEVRDEDGQLMCHPFRREEWVTVTAYGDDGYPVYCFVAPKTDRSAS